MKRLAAVFAFAALIGPLLGSGVAWSQDAMKVVQDRQALMKRQSKDLEAVKNFLDGKGDLAAAQTGAADLENNIHAVSAAFPKDTGMAQFPGKSGAKPVIWTEWDKFTAAQQNAAAKAAALDAALKGGDKAAIAAAFADMGKNGCGGCHTTFREKI